MSNKDHKEFSRPPGDGKVYDPILYDNLLTERKVATALGSLFGVIGLLIILFAFFESDIKQVGTGFVVIFFGWGVLKIWGVGYKERLNRHIDNIDAVKANNSMKIQSHIEESKKAIEETQMSIEQQKDILNKLQKANSTGDIVISGNKAPIIIDSKVINSFNTITKDDPELASVIKTLGGYIENSGNQEAADIYRELHTKIASGERNKTILKTLWNGIVKVLPDVEKLTEITVKIKSLFL